MKNALYSTFILISALLLMSSSASAAECSGSWQVLHNYRGGAGGPCAAIGLNTHQATCQPGQRYATYCDDASGGRYRICQSNIACSRDRRGGYGYDGSRDDSRDSRDGRYDRRDGRNDQWDDRHYRRGDRRDTYRDDRRDTYRDDRRSPTQDCTQWDFSANRPCPPGTTNRDCQKDCGGR